MIPAPTPIAPPPSNSLISRIRATSFPRFPTFTSLPRQTPLEDSDDGDGDDDADNDGGQDLAADNGEAPKSRYHFSSDSSDIPDDVAWEDPVDAAENRNRDRYFLGFDVENDNDVPQQDE